MVGVRVLFLLLLVVIGCVGISCRTKDKISSDSISEADLHSSKIGSSANKIKELSPDHAPSPIGIYEEFYPCDKGLETANWNDMTDKERMLALGYEILEKDGKALDKPAVIRPVMMASNLIMKYYLVHQKAPESIEQLWECYYSCVGKAYSDLGHNETEVREAFNESLTSPVTGKLLEWDHQNFSRGNAYITIVNENPDALEVAEEDWQRCCQNRPTDPENPSKLIDLSDTAIVLHMYCRVYGETGIIDNIYTHARWTNEQMDKLKKYVDSSNT